MRSYMTGGQGQGAPGGYAPLAGGDFDDLGGIRQPDFSSESAPTTQDATYHSSMMQQHQQHQQHHVHHAHQQQHHGQHLIATCPKCMSQLMIPPGVPTVACGSCGQAISPVVQSPTGGQSSQWSGGGEGAGGGSGAHQQHMQAAPTGNMVKCPLCAAVLQQPPGAALAICGGCHQVIAMPGSSGGGQHGGEVYAAAGGGQHQMPGSGAAAMQNMPAIIACPNCSMRLQPPPGAPLVACGGCRQVMQVPGV